jgi:phosphopantothenoylcysteine synthetase/decarboxylase
MAEYVLPSRFLRKGPLMNASKQPDRGTLYVVSCATSSTPLIYDLVEAAQAAGWDVHVILTPSSRPFVDETRLTLMTGHKVWSEFQRPGEPDIWPPAEAVLVFPLSFNSLSKWALGISDTFALSWLNQYTGQRKPIVAVPCFRAGSGLDTHPALPRNLRQLRRYGVHVIYEPETYPPKNQVPPGVILATLHDLIARQDH